MCLKKDQSKGKENLKQFIMQSDIQAFVKLRRQINENFNYWSPFIELVSLIKDLEPTGKELHLATVQRSLPVFAVFDAKTTFAGVFSILKP